MTSYDPQTATGLVADPQTPAQTLADIAAQHPALWPAVQQHPNAYPELIQWIQQSQTPAAPALPAVSEPVTVAEAPAGDNAQQSYAEAPGGYAQTPQDYAGAPQGYAGAPQGYAGAPQGYPGAPQGYPGVQAGYAAPQPGYGAPVAPKKKKTGLIAGIIVGALVIAGAAIAIPLMTGAFGGGNSVSLQNALKLVNEPDADYTLNVLDLGALEKAAGQPIPHGSGSELQDWMDLGVEDGTEVIATNAVTSFSPELLAIASAGGGQLELIDRSGSSSVSAIFGSTSDAQLDDAFGSAKSGFWYDSHDMVITQVGGTAYFGWDASLLPTEPIAEKNSLAANEYVVGLANLLQKTDAYAYVLENDEYPADNIEYLTGESVDQLMAYGSALSYRDGVALITTAYVFGDSETAKDNLDLMTEAIEASAKGLGQSAPLKVYLDGSTVVAEFEADADYGLISLAFDLRNVYDY